MQSRPNKPHPKIKTAKKALLGLILALMGGGLSFAQKVKVGEAVPDFTVPLLDGQRTVRLSDFRGRRVLIFTWASW